MTYHIMLIGLEVTRSSLAIPHAPLAAVGGGRKQLLFRHSTRSRRRRIAMLLLLLSASARVLVVVLQFAVRLSQVGLRRLRCR